ncbi:MAG: hypothetical protein ACKPKO_41920, partial [Candidatus Fonsibacter sp.]
MQKEWQHVKPLVVAKSVEATAQEKTECEQVVGGDDNNVGSSGSAEATAATALTNRDMSLYNLAREHVRVYV